MKPTVVFLHGLGRTHRSLSGLRRLVGRHGYRTWGRTYPSRRMSLTDLAEQVATSIRADLGDGPILGVTHSLGGILVRHMGSMLEWQGVVMLAPPNTGSRVAAALSANPLFRWYFGPAGGDLGDPGRWPPPPEPYAVIAGTRGATLGNVPSWMISALALLPPGERSDGTVTVAETRLPGMRGFAEVDAGHTWLMNHSRTRDLVLHFLEHRQFRAQPPAVR